MPCQEGIETMWVDRNVENERDGNEKRLEKRVGPDYAEFCYL